MEVIMCLRAAVDLVLWIEVHNYLIKYALRRKLKLEYDTMYLVVS